MTTTQTNDILRAEINLLEQIIDIQIEGLEITRKGIREQPNFLIDWLIQKNELEEKITENVILLRKAQIELKNNTSLQNKFINGKSKN